MGESQGEQKAHLGERRSGREDGGKGGLHNERRRFQGGEGGQIRRATLGEVEESMSG